MQVETNHELSSHQCTKGGSRVFTEFPLDINPLHIYITPTRLANDVDFHLEPCHDAHQLKETDIPQPKAIVGGKCCPTMVYDHVIAGLTVTTLNMQHGLPLLALAALQHKRKTLGCLWKTFSSIFPGKSLFKVIKWSVRCEQNNSEFQMQTKSRKMMH